MKEFDLQLCRDIHTEWDSRENLLLVYVLDGKYRLTAEDATYDLDKGAILLLPYAKKFTAQTIKEGLSALFCLSYSAICQNLHTDYIRFFCNNRTEQGIKYQRLEQLLQKLLLVNTNDVRQVYQWKSLWYDLIAFLVEEFRIHEVSSAGRWTCDEDEQRISYIINYIYAHYAQPIRLSELAEQLFVSVSTLSRTFTKSMGQSFVSYVREYRLKKVLEDLTETEKPITQIAVENGFSNPSAMNKDFKARFGKSPSVCRKEQKQMDPAKAALAEEDRQEARRLLYADTEGAIWTGQHRRVQVNAADDGPVFPEFRSCLNVGPADTLMGDEMRSHVRRFRKDMGVSQIRIWNLFSNQMMMINERNSAPNFTQLDSQLDFCVDNQLDVFFDLSQRAHLAMANESEVIYQIEDNHLFTSQAAWEDFLKSFVQHLRQRYGERTAGRWVFEFTFYLNDQPYYVSAQYQNRIVWERGYEIIKNALPQALVAGPGMCGDYDEVLIAKRIDTFFETRYRPDIFTGFYFPYQNNDKRRGYKRLADPDYLRKEIALVNRLLSAQHFEGKHVVTDWTAFMGNRNFLNDSCFRGTYILKNVLENYAQADGLGLYFASDLINMYTDSNALLNGIGGLLTKDGIRKPAYYAFVFLNQMGKTVIAKGENYLVTKNSARDLQILCFHYTGLNFQFSLMEENAYKPQELCHLFEDQKLLCMTIRIDHLIKGDAYVIRQYIVNEKEGSILNAWVDLGCEKDLSVQEIDYLAAKAVPGMRIEKMPCMDGTLTLDFELLPHEMRFVSIRAQD